MSYLYHKKWQRVQIKAWFIVFDVQNFKSDNNKIKLKNDPAKLNLKMDPVCN